MPYPLKQTHPLIPEYIDGLNILTGETGAGKSIILGSVNLALGGRYSKDILRQGADYGLVELTFFVSFKSRMSLDTVACVTLNPS